MTNREVEVAKEMLRGDLPLGGTMTRKDAWQNAIKTIVSLRERIEDAGCDYCTPEYKNGTPQCPSCRMFHQGSC